MSPDDLPDKVASRVFNSIESGRILKVIQNGESLFEVQQGPDSTHFRVVNTNTFECSCGYPQEMALPCCRVCAAMMFVSEDPRERVPVEMRAGTLLRLYGGSIMHVDTTTLTNDDLRPPQIRRGRGRPKLKRVRSAVERANARTVTCSRCGKAGHNARSCRPASAEARFEETV